MNDFTKEELENILNGNVTLYPHTHCNLVNKIQSMLENYCENDYKKTFNETHNIKIKLKEEMILFLLRGGKVFYKDEVVSVEIKQEKDLVILSRDEYSDLKRNMTDPHVLHGIFRRIDK